MSLRCGCSNEGDEIVFGPKHQCGEPVKPLDPPRLIPSWVFTVPTEEPEEAEGVDLVAALKGAIQRARDLRKSDFTLSPPTEDPAEPRYMETLDADERGGR